MHGLRLVFAILITEITDHNTQIDKVQDFWLDLEAPQIALKCKQS